LPAPDGFRRVTHLLVDAGARDITWVDPLPADIIRTPPAIGFTVATMKLILNDKTTRLSRLTSEWFASDGRQPTPRIQLNYNDAIKSLVAAGYGATLLPHEASTPLPDTRIVMRPLQPLLWRQLGIAHRGGDVERPTQHVLDVLWGLSAG
jgi:DNA-binding transcriptional LysR family regulator